MKVRPRTIFAGALCAALVTVARCPGATYTLDDPASPIRVTFNDSGAKLTVEDKATGWTWINPDSGGGNAVTSVSSVTQPNARSLNANLVISGVTYSLALEVATSPSELRVTFGNTAANLNGIVYPFPFFASNGRGHAVVPFDSGYVVPTGVTNFSIPGGMRGMEWYGGTDESYARGWMAIVDTPDDYELKVRNACVIGNSTFLGPAPNWRGSNANATHTANKLSYDRKLRFRFLETGGYVALAKVFRADAQSRGWLKTLAEKKAGPGAPDLDRFIGAPVCYLWGDGRSTALLDAMKNAGIDKAHVQVSINHVDEQKNFPATSLADHAWFDAVRARGYLGGFYDIYAAVRTSGTGGSPYDGFYYLWPGNAYNDWAIINASGGYDAQHTISAQVAATFAAGTRMPAHVSRFNMDAYFCDVVCAVDLTEDYDTVNGHFATRSNDLTNRFNLLNTTFANPTKKLITGTEQGRSWAVPTLHWTEGKSWIGAQGTSFLDGSFNDNSYPQIMTDAVDPAANNSLSGALHDGYQVPLWDLVFHDCLVTTVHWHRCHNKFLGVWDHADRVALLRGQAPLLNMTYAGVQGLASRAPNTLTDSAGTPWSSRWTVMGDRFVQTYKTVCKWHEQVGYLEMINHARLGADRSVQMSEFSNDGGASGKGIVVNFGTYDNVNGYGGSTWSGTLRGTALTVPVRSYLTYEWNNIAANNPPGISNLASQLTTSGATVGPLAFSVADAETAASSLTVTAASSNTTLLPVANIALGGSGASRAATLTPTAGLTGTATVTLTVSDGALAAQTSFTLTVNASINTPPTRTSIPNQSTTSGTAIGPLAFTIGDAQTPPASLTVTRTSSNATLLPLANVVLGGSGADRTVILTPASGQTGSATVTITISDGSLTAQIIFSLTVVSGTNTAPTVSSIVNQTTNPGTPVGPLAFTIGDLQTAAGILTVTAASSDTALLPMSGIALGGSGADRTVTLTPASGQTGITTVTLTVGDGTTTTTRTFTLTATSSTNATPTITAIGSQTTSVNTSVGPLSFTVGDVETPAAALTITAGSSNTTLLPVANITSGGSGANRTVTLTPASGQTGSSTVSLTVSDGTATAQTSFTFTVSSGPQTITSLAALHQDGQTYLTWNEVADPTATYRVYRSTSPFTGTTQFNSGNLIGTASADSSFDARLTELRGTNYFYRITAAGPDLTSTQGLFVHTPAADGAAYYAVTAVVSGVEQLAIVSGQSTTAAPVNESVAMPEPVFQRSFTISSRTVETYVHWVSATATPLYPAMGNKNSVAHHLGLVRRGAAGTHSLLIRPHARMGSFLSTVTGTNDANEWVLTLDDWMPNSIENTFWYGYHATFDIETGLPQGASGLVHDYTTRRAKWEIEWALRTLPIDLNRVYMTGHSMGGIGSHFLSTMLRDKIAAIWTTSAKFDFSFLHDPNPANIWNEGSNERETSGDIMWGTVPADLPSSEGIPVYDRLNAGYLAEAFRADDLPVAIAFNGRNDVVVGWAEKIGYYQSLAAGRHGGIYFWDSGVHNRTGGEWVPQQSVNVLNRYRLNQSYPAFTNSTASGNPGNGAATNGNTFGTINGNLDWDTSSIVDTASQWRIRLLTVALSSTAGSIAAPTSANVDVTPRRLQSFGHRPGHPARYEVRDTGNSLLTQGFIVADADGLFTVPAVPVNPAGTILTLFAVQAEPPSLAWSVGGCELTWAATPGLRYQVEWSPDLAQWFRIGNPVLATTNSMTWIDDGALTGAHPSLAGRRFYRLRINE